MLEKCVERRGGQGAAIDSGSLALPIKGETALEVSPFKNWSGVFCACQGINRLGAILAGSWAVSGLSWDLLGWSWTSLGTVFCSPGEPLGIILAILGRLGVLFWPSGAPAKPKFEKTSIFEGLISVWFPDLAPKLEPKIYQNRGQKTLHFSKRFLHRFLLIFGQFRAQNINDFLMFFWLFV